jgi:hypothetical protein
MSTTLQWWFLEKMPAMAPMAQASRSQSDSPDAFDGPDFD